MTTRTPWQPSFKQRDVVRTYDNFKQWTDYYYQIKAIEKTQSKEILEIGVCTRTLDINLENRGTKVTTCDIEKNLRPDVVADVRNLPFTNSSFDAVCAFQVLEHLYFSDFKKALKEMKRVSKKWVIISVPYASIYLSVAVQITYFNFLKRFFDFFNVEPHAPFHITISVPLFFLDKLGLCKEHGWEIGRKGFPISKIRNAIKECGLEIVDEPRRIFYPYHHFFVLKK